MKLINVSDEEIKALAEKLHTIKQYGSNEETLSEALEYLIPKNEKMIGIEINDNLGAVTFDLDEEKVKISVKKLKYLIEKSIVILKKIFPDVNEQEMFNYYILYALTHEVRHVYQYLIGEGFIETPYQIVQKTYKDIMNIGMLKTNFIRNYISSILYGFHHERLVIERNANIEACEFLKSIAEYEENKPIVNVFEQVKQRNISYGYDDIYNGSIEETYKKLCLTPFYNELPNCDNIPIKDKILYGLPINEETKTKILETKKIL